MDKIGRRELLKLGLFSSFLHVMPRQAGIEEKKTIGNKPNNILIIVFDALSAHNINFYGYRRLTMPNLTKILDKATVYHNHYAGGPYTTPGTASLLTGTYPWTHRGLRSFGQVAPDFTLKNIFALFPDFYRFAYTQNPLADVLLDQFSERINDHIPLYDLYITNDWINKLFGRDYDIANLSESQIVHPGSEVTYSLVLSEALQYFLHLQKEKEIKGYIKEFPRGVPYHSVNNERYFTLEQPMDWLLDHIAAQPEPFLGYFHFLPPHDPYNTKTEFVDRFIHDRAYPVFKPDHVFSAGLSYDELVESSRMYDEYVLYVDSEFRRLFDQLQKLRILDDTILVFTSDHGELFERGIDKHNSPALFEPVSRIPLVIIEPGQNQRMDIYHQTSAVDILPTLLFLDGKAIPDWCEGEILPPYNTQQLRSDREVFVAHSRKYRQGKPIERASLMIRKGEYKLTKFFGWEQQQEIGTFCEMYNVEEDPEELNDLYSSRKDISVELERVLDERFQRAEEAYLAQG